MNQSHPWTKMTQGKLPCRQYRKNHISPKRPFSLTLSDALSPIFSTTKSWLSASHWLSIVFGAYATCTLKFISPDQWINAGKWLKVRYISLKVKISVVEMCVISGPVILIYLQVDDFHKCCLYKLKSQLLWQVGAIPEKQYETKFEYNYLKTTSKMILSWSKDNCYL